MPERVVIQTEDQVALIGTLDVPPGAKQAVLLLHMMPADRKSWAPLQSALRRRGIASLAIDLRGHGESTVQDGRRINYLDFSDAEHGWSLDDIRRAIQWLETRGFAPDRLALAGASIGANLALVIADENASVKAVALLSPGENYRGVMTFPAASGLRPEQSLFVAASQGDDQESFAAAQRIVELAPSTLKEFKPFASAGHGTNMFVTHPELVDIMSDWLAARLGAL